MWQVSSKWDETALRKGAIVSRNFYEGTSGPEDNRMLWE